MPACCLEDRECNGSTGTAPCTEWGEDGEGKEAYVDALLKRQEEVASLAQSLQLGLAVSHLLLKAFHVLPAVGPHVQGTDACTAEKLVADRQLWTALDGQPQHQTH